MIVTDRQWMLWTDSMVMELAPFGDVHMMKDGGGEGCSLCIEILL